MCSCVFGGNPWRADFYNNPNSAAYMASGVLRDTTGSLRSYARQEGAAVGLEQGSAFLEEQSRKGVMTQATEWMLIRKPVVH